MAPLGPEQLVTEPQAPMPGAPDCTIRIDTSDSAVDLYSKGVEGARPATAVIVASPATASRRRMYYVDWLRVLLTVVVVVHHCTTAYLGSMPWIPKRDDLTLWLIGHQLFVNGNQAYFMTLFFFLSGIYVPGSFRRKGPLRFLADRTLRLMLPCLVYSLIAPPLISWWTALAKSPAEPPSLAQAFINWLTPGWPTTYVLPTGPPWFLWMLWCFNVAYTILRLAGESPQGAKAVSWLSSRCANCSSIKRCRSFINGSSKPAASTGSEFGASSSGASESGSGSAPGSESGSSNEFTTRQALILGGMLAGVFFVLCYAVRMLDTFAFGVKPTIFVQRGPFVAFMPDYFLVYAVSFGLGTLSGPAGWDVLGRLPHWSGWCLCIGGLWWGLAGWLPNVMMHAMTAMQRDTTSFIAGWLLRTFVEQSFCLVWSAGLLMLFRDAFNVRPGRLGRIIIGAAYAAYLVHPLIIPLYARALMTTWFPSSIVSAAAISAPVVITTWLVASGLKAIPGAHRVL